MNGFEINKIFGAVTGTLAVFLALRIVSEGVFGHGPGAPDTTLAYAVDIPEQGAAAPEPTPLPVLLAAADPADGERVFGRCVSCHALDANGTGPLLYGVIGREKGAIDGFGYSGALASADGVWDFETMDAFLARPDDVVDGTSMNFQLRNPEQRAAVIVWLNQQSDNPLPLPEPPAEEAAPDAVDAAADGDAMMGDDAAPEAAGEAEPPADQ